MGGGTGGGMGGGGGGAYGMNQEAGGNYNSAPHGQYAQQQVR